jgi:hypothetical protein
MTLSIEMPCHHAEYHISFIDVLNIPMLSDIMSSVIMLSVLAPF